MYPGGGGGGGAMHPSLATMLESGYSKVSNNHHLPSTSSSPLPLLILSKLNNGDEAKDNERIAIIDEADEEEGINVIKTSITDDTKTTSLKTYNKEGNKQQDNKQRREEDKEQDNRRKGK